MATTEEPTEVGDGWILVHEQPEQRTVLSETQGLAQVTPANYRAEKQINGQLVSVQAETIEDLEARAAEIDDAPVVEPLAPELLVVDEGQPDPPATVITEEGRFTEEDWSRRLRSDTVIEANEDGDPEQKVYVGGAEEIEEAIAKADEAALTEAQEAAAEEPVETSQFSYDTSMALDAPGQSAGGTLVVPEGVETVAEAQEKQNEISQEAETERVLTAEEAQAEAQTTGYTQGPTAEAQDEAHAAEINAVKDTRDKQSEPHSDSSQEEQTAAAIEAREGGEFVATPGAVEAADELGVDLSDVEGTGSGGKITKADVESHAND